jgi:hypothetical protein
MVAAVTSYFINLSTMLYYIALGLADWISGNNYKPVNSADFSTFSLAYMAILVFLIELLVTSKKDLSIFIRLMSYGSAFIIALILFIIGFGFYGVATTDYVVVGSSYHIDPYTEESKERYLKLFYTDFSPLAGALGIGYFLHTVSLPIVRNNENQKNNERDVFCGYLLCWFYLYICRNYGFNRFHWNVLYTILHRK